MTALHECVDVAPSLWSPGIWNTSGSLINIHMTLITTVLWLQLCYVLTFLWEASALPEPGLSVQQLALGTCGCHWSSPNHISIIAERVPPARIPGGVLPQPPLGLGLQTCLMDAVARGRHPVAIDLVVNIFIRDNETSIVFLPRHKRVTQVSNLCWFTRENCGEFVFGLIWLTICMHAVNFYLHLNTDYSWGGVKKKSNRICTQCKITYFHPLPHGKKNPTAPHPTQLRKHNT